MTTSIDPSVDELLLLQENQYHMPNFLLTNLKPIGAERKIGQPTIKSSFLSSEGLAHSMHIDFASKDQGEENNNYFNSITTTKPTTSSIYEHFSPLDELESSPYRNYSSNSLDNSIYQRQLVNQTISNPGKVIPPFCAAQTYPTSRFYTPQQYPRNSFCNISQQIRSIPPVFSAPSQCTRERFQVNSIGRPILRTNTYHHLSQVHHHFKVRR